MPKSESKQKYFIGLDLKDREIKIIPSRMVKISVTKTNEKEIEVAFLYQTLKDVMGPSLYFPNIRKLPDKSADFVNKKIREMMDIKKEMNDYLEKNFKEWEVLGLEEALNLLDEESREDIKKQLKMS